MPITYQQDMGRGPESWGNGLLREFSAAGEEYRRQARLPRSCSDLCDCELVQGAVFPGSVTIGV